MELHMRTALLAAVSSAPQAERVSIPQQLEMGRKQCEARDWDVSYEIVINGHSRNYLWLHEIIKDCAGYAELVSLIEEERVDLVVARDYDRLWRTDALRAQVTALCKQHKVQIFSINQPVEPVAPQHLAEGRTTAQAMEVLFGLAAEQENAARKRRHHDGMVGRVKRGAPPSTAPYGYRKSEDGERLEIVPEEARWVREIFRMRGERTSFSAIAAKLNADHIPAPSGKRWYGKTVWIIVNNSVYRGRVHWGKHVAEGQHEPIIDDSIQDRVDVANRIMAPLHNSWKRTRPRQSLLHLAKCGYCGWGMSFNGPQGHQSIVCNQYLATRGQACRCNSNSAPRTERYVLGKVRSTLECPDEFLQFRGDQLETGSLKDRMDGLDVEIKRLDAAWQNWTRMVDEGKLPDELIMEQYKRLVGTRDRLTKKRAQLEREYKDYSRARGTLYGLQDVLGVLDTLDSEELNDLFGTLIECVYLKRGEEPRIVWL